MSMMKHNQLALTIVMVLAIVVLTINNSHNAFRRATAFEKAEAMIFPAFTARTAMTTKPRIPATSVTSCPAKTTEEIRKLRVSKSQSSEDFVLLRWFSGLCHGTFIELGALDGIRYSNSYLFEFALQWRGLLIEITPDSFEALEDNRPNNVLVHAGVCEQRQTIHHYKDVATVNAVAGIVEFAADDFRKRWWPNLKDDLSNSVEMECIPLQEIIEEEFVPAVAGKAGPSSVTVTADGTTAVHFDFLSLDVEGAEDQVLRSVDFTKVSFGVVLLEADDNNERKNMAIRTFLESKGYLFLMSERRSYWFVHKQFDQIYGHVLH